MPYTPPLRQLRCETGFGSKSKDENKNKVIQEISPLQCQKHSRLCNCGVYSTARNLPQDDEQNVLSLHRALRTSPGSDSSSASSPTSPKSVHFDTVLDICPFFTSETPISVSTRSSSTCRTLDSKESSREFGWIGPDDTGPSTPIGWTAVPSYNRTITNTTNEPPVIFCGLRVANEQQSLVGCAAVANIAYHKSVTCLFTFDDWTTVSTVAATFVRHVDSKDAILGHDWFTFEIDISGINDLQLRTCSLCIRYIVDNQEFWDNNGGSNFQVNFTKQDQERRLLNKANVRDQDGSIPSMATTLWHCDSELGHINKEDCGMNSPVDEIFEEVTPINKEMVNYQQKQDIWLDSTLQTANRASMLCPAHKDFLEKYCFFSSDLRRTPFTQVPFTENAAQNSGIFA
ncbi:hypothetical protein VHEMI05868 [[Torrubiella] hemipterigena]|uniref:CBM21 domain-containing protein n=1 Tax=[Torrubiella] hemipterigena TaxID=1531966 RepID=A0A0A1THQ4_9HYPO|nr:hypothetical protein VHEMI05868 [[Torrubiella] hemipterigena]